MELESPELIDRTGLKDDSRSFHFKTTPLKSQRTQHHEEFNLTVKCVGKIIK